MYTNILVAVDGSEQNKTAVRAAVDIAAKMGSKLTAVYVENSSEVKPNAFGGDVSAEERKAIIEKAATEAFELVESLALKEGIEFHTVIRTGKPCDEIVAITGDYDLLVCGSLGRTGLAKLMGSVSKTLVQYAKCPVLVIR